MTRKKKHSFKEGNLPELTSKTHHTLVTFGKVEVFLAWNNTMLKPTHLRHLWYPSIEHQRTSYGHDVSLVWLGGIIEISYTK